MRGIEGLAIVLGETLTLGQALGIEDFIQLESQIAGTEQRLTWRPTFYWEGRAQAWE